MKRIAVLWMGLLLVLSLCACSTAQTVYTVEKNGCTFDVDAAKGTIFDGTYTYSYTFSGDASSYNVDIRYPNGASYYWSQSGASGHGGWSDDYDDTLYADGDTLCDVIKANAPQPSNPTKFIAILLLLVIGALNAVSPRTAWYWQYGWRFRDVEPSDLALSVGRAVGIAAMIAALLLIVL